MNGPGSDEHGASGVVRFIIGETTRSRGIGMAVAAQYSGRFEAGQLGPVEEGFEGEPDLTLSVSSVDARLIEEGKLEPSVAFMQGRLKSTGDNALLLELLAWSATADFRRRLASTRSDRRG